MSEDVLPDSRCQRSTGVVRHAQYGNQVPIFCANCGTPGGYVPEKWITSCFYLCFATGTPVRTREGWTPIEDLVPGTEVLTHLGRWRRVTASAITEKGERAVFSVKAVGDPDPLIVTEGHRFFVLRHADVTEYPGGPVRWAEAENLQPKWTPVEEIGLRDYLCYPIDTDEVAIPEFTAKLARILGYYAAEGHIQRRTDGSPKDAAVRWTFHIKEREFVQELRDCLLAEGFREPRHYDAPAQNAQYVVCADQRLIQLCTTHVGRGSATKNLSEEILSASRVWQMSFLGAYLNGDGHQDSDGAIRFASSSETMARQIQAMILRQGIWCPLHREPRQAPAHTAVYGRIGSGVAAPFSAVSKYRSTDSKANNRCKAVNGVFYRPVTEILRMEDPPKAFVDISVEEDESFVAGLAAAHNCQPCADAGHGDLAHLYSEPDDVWRKRAAEALAESKLLTAIDVAIALEDPSTALGKLAADWRAHVIKTTT